MKLAEEELAAFRELNLLIREAQIALGAAQCNLNRKVFEIDLKYKLMGKKARINEKGEIITQEEPESDI